MVPLFLLENKTEIFPSFMSKPRTRSSSAAREGSSGRGLWSHDSPGPPPCDETARRTCSRLGARRLQQVSLSEVYYWGEMNPNVSFVPETSVSPNDKMCLTLNYGGDTCCQMCTLSQGAHLTLHQEKGWYKVRFLSLNIHSDATGRRRKHESQNFYRRQKTGNRNFKNRNLEWELLCFPNFHFLLNKIIFYYHVVLCFCFRLKKRTQTRIISSVYWQHVVKYEPQRFCISQTL